MKLMSSSFIAILLATITSSQLHAQRVESFDQKWQQLHANSLKQKSASLDVQYSELGLNRARLHWLPRAYLQGHWVRTNDPAQVLFNNLAQREVKSADFLPSELNLPGYQTYKTATIGIDLPLFEGGSKQAQQSMLNSLLLAAENEQRAKKSEDYRELGQYYAGLLISQENSEHLHQLETQLQSIIKNYQMGAQSSPLGHSGLLGLKGVQNRLEALATIISVQSQQSYQWIDEKTAQDIKWQPQTESSLQKFLIKNFSEFSSPSLSTSSLALKYKIESMSELKNMERARYLPRIGLFAQNSYTDGQRGSDDSQSFGLYMAWDIFNPDSYGRQSEAVTKHSAEQSRFEGLKQEESIQRKNLVSQKEGLRNLLEILDNSSQLLSEQSINSMKLFRSGALNALQLAEVINRRIDLIEKTFQVQNQYLQTWMGIYQINN